MHLLQLTALLVTLSAGALGALLPGDAGYQYDRPGFAGDFGRRPGDLARFPNRPGYNNNLGYNNQFGRPGYPGAGYAGNLGAGYNGYRGAGYNGYNGNYNGYNNGYNNYNGADGSYRGYDGRDGPSRPYNFQYEVNDPPTGNSFGQQEAGDGAGSVQGEYRVLLPDSRTQIVRYTADDANGYVADVRYEGEAQYPNGPGRFGLPGGRYPGVGYNPGLGYPGRGYAPGVVGTGVLGTGLLGTGVVGPNGLPNGLPNGYGGLANQYLPAGSTYGKK